MPTKIAISFEPIRELLADELELRKLKKLLARPAPAVDSFLDALDRADVVIGMILAPAFGVPGIVPAFIALKDDQTFAAAIKGDDLLKKCLGAVTKVRAKSLGLVPTGRKGRVGYWMPGFTVAEVYEPTAAVWSVWSFVPPLPKGANILGVLMAVAEFERGIIRERVKAGVAAAKARGVKLGRPPRLKARAPEFMALKKQGLGIRAISRSLGMPVSSVHSLVEWAERGWAAAKDPVPEMANV